MEHICTVIRLCMHVYYIVMSTVNFNALQCATHSRTDRRSVGRQSSCLSREQFVRCLYRHWHTSGCPSGWKRLMTPALNVFTGNYINHMLMIIIHGVAYSVVFTDLSTACGHAKVVDKQKKLLKVMCFWLSYSKKCTISRTPQEKDDLWPWPRAALALKVLFSNSSMLNVHKTDATLN